MSPVGKESKDGNKKIIIERTYYDTFIINLWVNGESKRIAEETSKTKISNIFEYLSKRPAIWELA